MLVYSKAYKYTSLPNIYIMSSDGDQVAFQNAVKPHNDPVLFNDKNFAFITDSTSNSGAFSSGQIQFDLGTLSSQAQWVNLAEAVIEIPIKITAQLTTAGVGGSPSTSAAALTAISKAGHHHWVDSCQLIVNGTTIQSAQIYENVAATFRILSSWSQDTLKKWGSTCGVALDDMTGDAASIVALASGMNNTALNTSTGATGNFNTVKGFDVLKFGQNKGAVARSQLQNTDIGVGVNTLATSILGAASIKSSGKAHVATATASNTANTNLYSQYMMATIRLKDICQAAGQMPMVKNLKGQLYLNFNAFQVNLTGSVGAATIGSVSYTPLAGRSCPFMINESASGLVMGNGTTSGPVVQVVGTVDGTTNGAVGSAGPMTTNARFIAPYYLANPSVDEALSGTRHFRSLERIVNPLTVAAGQAINTTITVGVQNPRRLIILPMWSNLGGVTNLTSPEQSAFDTTPSTSGPFAYLSQLQAYVGNKPCYQYPVTYDFEQWLIENSCVGANGALVNEMTSGLLTQQLWEQNHRFYCVDLSRRYDSEDGSSKSVQVSFTNPSSTYALRVIVYVEYEKQWTINTATCSLAPM